MSRSYRFFIDGINAAELEKEVLLNASEHPNLVEQMGKVLRVKEGDSIVLLPVQAAAGETFEYVYEVAGAHKKEVALTFVKKVLNENELEFPLGLVLCLPNKPDKLSLIVQKAVELGVTEIILVSGEFSQMKHKLREDRLGSIVREAAEQAERAVVPSLSIRGSLEDYLRETGGGAMLVAMERSNDKSLAEALEDFKGTENGVRILVGPEGGFSDAEKALIEELDLITFTLGKRVLRMETAAIVAIGIVATTPLRHQ